MLYCPKSRLHILLYLIRYIIFVLSFKSVDYGAYSGGAYTDAQQYGYYAAQGYPPYVSSPSSSGSLGTSTYQLAAASLPGTKFGLFLNPNDYCKICLYFLI